MGIDTISANGYYPDMDTLADTIRKEFRKSGRTILSVADDSGLGYANVHRLINTTDRVTLATADKVCRALGLRLVPKGRKGK